MEEDYDYPMTVGDWMITTVVLAIPVVNIIMFLVWAFGSSGNTSRKTYCQAGLLWMLIGIIAMLIFGSLGALTHQLVPAN